MSYTLTYLYVKSSHKFMYLQFYRWHKETTNFSNTHMLKKSESYVMWLQFWMTCVKGIECHVEVILNGLK